MILLSKPGPSHLHPYISENNIIEAKEGRINRMRITIASEMVTLFPKTSLSVYGPFWEFSPTI